MSFQRLQKIDAMFNEEVDKNHVPGIVALIAGKGKVVFH
jgi:hypothetical protein